MHVWFANGDGNNTAKNQVAAMKSDSNIAIVHFLFLLFSTFHFNINGVCVCCGVEIKQQQKSWKGVKKKN